MAALAVDHLRRDSPSNGEDLTGRPSTRQPSACGRGIFSHSPPKVHAARMAGSSVDGLGWSCWLWKAVRRYFRLHSGAVKTGRRNLKRLRRTPFKIAVGTPFRIRCTRRPDRTTRQAVVDEIIRELAGLLPDEYRGAYADAPIDSPRYLEFVPVGEVASSRTQP